MFFTKERKEEIISAFQSAFDDYIDNPEFDLNTSELNVKQSNKDGMRLELGYYPNMLSFSIDYYEDINLIFMSRITKVVNENSDGGELLVFIHNNIDIPSKDMDYQSYKDAFSFSLDKIIEMKTNENAEIIKAVYSRYYRFFELGFIEDRKNMFGMMMEYHKSKNRKERKEIKTTSYFSRPELKISEHMLNNTFSNPFRFEYQDITPETLEKYANPTESYVRQMIETMIENQYYTDNDS
jgi:hypothetical protein